MVNLVFKKNAQWRKGHEWEYFTDEWTDRRTDAGQKWSKKCSGELKPSVSDQFISEVSFSAVN